MTSAVPVEAATAGNGPAEFLCGKCRLDRSRVHALLAGLPDIVYLSARLGAHPKLHAAINLLAAEVNADRQGPQCLRRCWICCWSTWFAPGSTSIR